MTEDEMLGWHHQLNGHEFEQASGAREGQGSLVCCSPLLIIKTIVAFPRFGLEILPKRLILPCRDFRI